jgi:transcriptional regulator NrdR family protein
VDAADIEAIVDRVELAAEGTRGELSSERIGELCLEELSGLDRGAYLQFAGTLPSISSEAAASEPAPAGAGSVRAAREDPEFT